ncbi:zinc-dependent metalloprotease [Shewanella fodinae]|uniref:zinc-dependent metalloprotease n=1 Tax=Shewanella fodinae TaxID=552357 RepID=UPI00167B92D5|nr:zinc-dependent metalloprotease [Shewanella fodinae]MCL2905897.1 zinc-dependent metalloprotease [Shewanella fodinae]
MKPFSGLLWWLLLLMPLTLSAAEDSASVIRNSDKAEGFINFYFDNGSGQLYLEANHLNRPMLLLTSLPQGAGSNDIGLDRGQLGNTRMVQLERQGPYVLLKQLNTRYRAGSNNPFERRAVADAFANSVLWQGKLLPGKRLLVPLNELLLTDLHGITQQLSATGQGHYHLDQSRSVILPTSVKSFERNSDVDVQLTFGADKAGAQVADVAPDGQALSLQVRFSFIALPEPGYQPRAYTPMSGYLADEYRDYATPIDQDMTKRLLLRHRLQKVHPGPAPSEVIKPIVYYLDPGVPEPIRSALLEGGRWWSQAFAAAGFLNAFKMEMLPDYADPQDIRYNVVQWVHRATRGWSYGAVVTDPRTGEIIKGQVTLGSLRVRQDLLIARGVTAGWSDRVAADNASMALALARIRQLAAHEIGHTLGLSHNFAASSNGNASVMDYPHPYIRVHEGQIDISQPYREGIGEWDKFAIAYGYGDFGEQTATRTALAELLQQVQQQGLRYIAEADSRQSSAANAWASLWDRGDDPVVELERLQQVRKLALQQFSGTALLNGQPLGELADALVPVYLLSRYQLQAAAKFIGGIDYSYQADIHGGSWHYMAPEMQLRALQALLAALDSDALYLPTSLYARLVPKAGDYQRSRESFASSLGVANDPQAMAEALSRHVVSLLLQSERLNRIAQQASRDNEQLSLSKLLDQLAAKTLLADLPSGDKEAVAMRVNAVVLDAVLDAMENPASSPEVRAQLRAKLTFWQQQFNRKEKRVTAFVAAHYQLMQSVIEQQAQQPSKRMILNPVPMPPGAPI